MSINSNSSVFAQTGSSYSGCDIIPVIYGVDAATKKSVLHVIGDIQTLTYSIHRDKGAVRTLGRAFPKSFTRAQYTIAGSIIFSVFNQRALWDLSKVDDNTPISLAASLPGFDIILYFSNEYGQESTLVIYNVQIMDEGQSHSVEDIYIENTMSFIAQDIQLMEPRNFYKYSNEAAFLSKKREDLSLLEQSRIKSPGNVPFNYTYTKL